MESRKNRILNSLIASRFGASGTISVAASLTFYGVLYVPVYKIKCQKHYRYDN